MFKNNFFNIRKNITRYGFQKFTNTNRLCQRNNLPSKFHISLVVYELAGDRSVIQPGCHRTGSPKKSFKRLVPAASYIYLSIGISFYILHISNHLCAYFAFDKHPYKAVDNGILFKLGVMPLLQRYYPYFKL